MCPNAKDKYAVLCFQPFCKTRFSFYLQLSCAINVKYKKMECSIFFSSYERTFLQQAFYKQSTKIWSFDVKRKGTDMYCLKIRHSISDQI